ncbi:MAG TPA: alanine racemase [candidate division Zixibacteria bacterium]|nr:alanine racemase [candidate division Zixibacteria bacterium]
MNNTKISTSLSWIEVSRENILNNIRVIRKKIGPDIKIAAVVKANAYGHGYHEIAQILEDEQIEFLAVHSLEEAFILNEGGYSPELLIVGYVPYDQLNEAVESGFHLTVYNTDTIRQLEKLKTSKKAKIHLKLETGTNRQGIDEKELPSFIGLLKNTKKIDLIGASTHFANIEDTTDHSYAQSQLDRYKEILAEIENAGLEIPIKHTASSAASLLFSKTHYNMIRFGISLYGLWPSKETYLSYRLAGGENNLLTPALTWKTKVAQIKNVPKGSFIGYGCTYRTTADSKIAVLPLGYYDGYDRKLSNLGYVLIKGERAQVRGRICMDNIMVDVTNIPNVKIEDEVVLLGRQDGDVITAEQMASWAQTINYEIVARINPLLPRKII